MDSKKWIRFWLFTTSIIIFFSVSINYIIDPYDIYGNKIFSFYKIKKHDKIRLVKAVQIKEKNIKSLILGTSRATYGYDPTHKYFEQPAYNAAIPGGTMYENLLYLKETLKGATLKNVLLVLDYRMFTATKQKRVNDFESYFENDNLKFKYLFSLTQLRDSISTIKDKPNNIKIYLDNGFREENISLKRRKNQYNFMIEDESTYYEGYSTDYLYGDTQNSSFDDFRRFLALIKENDLNLTIIYGPSHIRLWEALDYYLDYDLWLKWKKDVVLEVDAQNKSINKKITIYDFSTYNEYTDEKIPEENKEMKYFFDSNHYKKTLGNLVLDYLNNDFTAENFGVEINIDNIDSHLENLKDNRVKYIDIYKYKQVMDEYIYKKKKK